MPCLKPVPCWRSRSPTSTGKLGISHSFRQGFSDLPMKRPCGQCRWCRLNDARNWAIRASHEASLYADNCFITLTYAPEHLPEHGFLDYEHPVSFMKDLRSWVSYRASLDDEYSQWCRDHLVIRSFGCAEYGEEFARPHYHICLFNWDFPDRVFLKNLPSGFPVFTSRILSSLWPFGHSSIGSLTFESSSYVARYVTKKFTGKDAAKHYEFIAPDGEVLQRPPERAVCVSRMPGIGKPWFDKFGGDVFPSDHVVSRGRVVRAPSYYSYLHKLDSEREFSRISRKRWLASHTCCGNKFCLHINPERDWPRLGVLERLQELRFNLLDRKLENGST